MRTDDFSAELQPDRSESGGAEGYDPERAMRPARHSFIRIRVNDPYEVDPVYAEPPTLRVSGAPQRAMLADDQLNLTVNLLHLARLLEGDSVGAWCACPETRRTIEDGVGDLEDVRESIERVLVLRDARLERLLSRGAALSAYLGGLYLYSEGIVEAFEEALCGLARLDGGALRFRLAAASQFYFDGLIHAVRFDLARAPATGDDEAPAAVEELFFAATLLHDRIRSGG